MRVAIASIVILLGLGVWCGGASIAAAQGQPAIGQPTGGQGGAKYAHTLGASRFAVGDGSHRETDGPFERVIGDKGVFFVDTVTGATLAVPNGVAVPKPPADAPASANPPEALNYPQPMTTNPDEHSAAVAAYLVAAGVPAAEVSGMHVTTTMAGRRSSARWRAAGAVKAAMVHYPSGAVIGRSPGGKLLRLCCIGQRGKGDHRGRVLAGDPGQCRVQCPGICGKAGGTERTDCLYGQSAKGRT
jgi:hypothetical protein